MISQINWSWQDKTIEVGGDSQGKGSPVLMLPARSSISTRTEMRPLAEQLASAFTTISVDWPGFGDKPRPSVAWNPEAYRTYLWSAQALYRLNVNQPMIRMMARGHIYADPAWLDERRLAEKLAVTTAPGARHASFRFVTGELDPMPNREQFLATVRRVTDPILVVYGAATPKRSKAEMQALANVRNVHSLELPAGKLAIHEEFPSLVADAVRSFLRSN
jgi:hypothetical protein